MLSFEHLCGRIINSGRIETAQAKGAAAMIDNAAQQTLDFIQYSVIFGELDSKSGDKSPDENTAECSTRNSGGE